MAGRAQLPCHALLVPHNSTPVRLRGYGVDVPAMSLELHEWDIHIE
jgi:hypothetical protein